MQIKKKNKQNLQITSESTTIEWKPSLSQINEIINTISAFSNAEGGRILIGVSNTGKIAGVQIGQDTIENLTNSISQHTDPKVLPRITTKKIKDKEIIIIDVKESSDHLVLAFGRPYKRVGRSTIRMSKDEYERLILEKHKEKLRFDKQICEESKLKDIDWDFVKKEFVPLYERVSKRRIVSSPQSLLGSLECIKDNKPTNAGILLFGKRPQRFFINSYIALARYRDNIVGTERLDYREFDGNLFKQIDECEGYIKEHIAIMSKQHPFKVQRDDIPEYGLFSIRELVTNAACHRDYENQHTKIMIKIFNDRIEFYNPGSLPNHITPKNITEKQFSRNPIIAKALAKVGYIEEFGEGWDKIIEEHKRHVLKPKRPRIKADPISTLVVIFSVKDKFQNEEIKKLELNERQKKILEFVREQGKITNRDHRKLFPEISDRTALNDLKDMVRKRILTREGKTKSAVYRIPK